ncbi:uncharacterized protein JCM6883_003077 [Sporobolomyces salmoneus]|uniref:uncharacterized protein n=1 Tax=Sporobolomyces salmoneus TaxID=183962 RepID=UPI00316F7F27
MQVGPIASTSALSAPSRNLFSSTPSDEGPRPRESIIRLPEDVWGALSWPPMIPNESEEEPKGNEQPRPVEETGFVVDEQLGLTSAAARGSSTIARDDTASSPNPEQEEDKAKVRHRRILSSNVYRSPPRQRSASPRRPPPPTQPRSNDPPAQLRNDVLRNAQSVPYLSLTSLQNCLQFLEDYKPYIEVDSLIAPTLSFAYPSRQIEFCCRLVDYRLWSSKLQSRAFDLPVYSALNLKLMDARLNLEQIRREFPLGDGGRETKGPAKGHPFWNALEKTLNWVYGKRISVKEACWFLERIPTNLLVLVRLHADLAHYSYLVHRAFIDFRCYLRVQRFCDLDPMLQRARTLIEWLTLSSGGTNSARFILWWSQEVTREREGRRSLTERWMNQEGGWETTAALDSWEEQVTSAGNWS